MKKLLIIFCTPLLLFAQEGQHKVTWNSNFLFESNGLNRSFLNSMLYGGYITDSMKTKWINSGDNNNVIYSELSNGFTYINTKKNIGFSFADRNILNANFKDDLLRISFEGNFHHQDKTLDISNTNIRADRFQQYKIIYGIAKDNSINMTWGFSYLAGNHHLSYIIEKGSVYTAPFGTYLDVEYDMQAFVTDTSDLSISTHNGNGLAIDFSTDFSIQKYDVHLSITDLGFIMWNNSSITLATDSIFKFQGVEIEDILNFNDSVLEVNNIIDDVSKTNTSSFKSYIPATVHLSISGETKHNYLKTYTAGLVAKWQPYMDNEPLSFAKINQGFKESNFSPLYYIHTMFNTKYCDVMPSLSYGGYTNDPNIGVALSKEGKYKLVVGTHHLEDIFSGEEAKAVSVYFSVARQF
jgi:hypothetical protein